jgi:hypothetical protein
MKPHKHAELIKAWADGAVIERLWSDEHWLIDNQPMWEEWEEYRIKPEPKPDMYLYLVNCYEDVWKTFPNKQQIDDLQIKLIIDGETGELKLAEVLK